MSAPTAPGLLVTLTANPSIDCTAAIGAELERGQVIRAETVTEQAAGKGVNISRAAVAAGVPTIAVLPAEQDSAFVHELLAVGIDCRPEPPSGPVRRNITLTEPDGTTTKINSPGAKAEPWMLDRLAEAVVNRAQQASWVVLAGSLPQGAPDGWYAEVARHLEPLPTRVAVDTSDGPLAAVGERLADARPDLLKPNAEELAQLTGVAVTGPADAAATARLLVDKGARGVLVTLGGDGAVLVDEHGAWHATPPPIRVVSTVGAGDSSLFGYVLGDLRGAGPEERLRLAVAYGTAAASLPGTTIPSPDQTHPERVEVRALS